MSGAAFDSVLTRDRVVVLAALVLIAALAWAYVVWLAGGMSMDMGGMGGMAAPMPRAWSDTAFALTFVMWAVMMIGMMVPSAAPMILIYERVARQAEAQGRAYTSTLWFAGGYLIAWTAFAAVAAIAQGALADAALITPMLASGSRYFGGAVLIAAGVYQWTPLKNSCLAKCRAPLQFIMQHGGFRPGARNALSLGIRHGLYCVGCCWVLMALLFVGGVMNILWIAGLAIFVLLEKVLPAGRIVSRVAGVALAGAGVWLMFG